mmetsp:Transcript_30810/g.36621  ORF Transcript_30810/g.36621 Transcript_30810/m.36621 type:complete len:82 (+) Transcript_30810:178-423(+)
MKMPFMSYHQENPIFFVYTFCKEMVKNLPLQKREKERHGSSSPECAVARPPLPCASSQAFAPWLLQLHFGTTLHDCDCSAS